MMPMPLVRSSQMRLCVSSSSYSPIFESMIVAELEHLLVPARRNVQRQPADPHRVVGEARAAELFEQVQDQLALAERVEEHRHRADVHRVRADPQAMARDPLQLAQDRPHVPRAARHLDRHQLLDRFAVADVVGGRRDVVHPIGQQDDLRPVPVLAQLLDAAVQIADHDVGVDDLLAVQAQHHAQHAMRARMLRAHVDHELVRVEHRAVVDVGVVILLRRHCGSSFACGYLNVEPASLDRAYSMSASSLACRSFSQSSGFSISSSPGPSSG